MDYYSFFKKLKAEDPRIEYATAHKAPECKGLNIPQFYKTIDPINVEFGLECPHSLICLNSPMGAKE